MFLRELQREKVWSRIHLVPLLLAEGDRDAYRRQQAALEREREIMKDVPERLATICGGTPEDSPNGLPACSWEQAMKAYILTWP